MAAKDAKSTKAPQLIQTNLCGLCVLCGRKRALSAADAMGDEARNAAGERMRVLNEIERQSGVYGSVTKAIK